MASAKTGNVRKTLLKAIESNAEAAITAAPPDVEAFARATNDLTSAYLNIHVIAPEDS